MIYILTKLRAIFESLVPESVIPRGNNKELLFIIHTVEHNYISPSSTVGIQLHVWALYVGHYQMLVLSILAPVLLMVLFVTYP